MLEGVEMRGNVFSLPTCVSAAAGTSPGREREVIVDASCIKAYFSSCRRDVFACIGLPAGDMSWERSFSRWPLGVCDYLVPAQRQFHPREWALRTRNIYNWSEPHNRCTLTN